VPPAQTPPCKTLRPVIITIASHSSKAWVQDRLSASYTVMRTGTVNDAIAPQSETRVMDRLSKVRLRSVNARSPAKTAPLNAPQMVSAIGKKSSGGGTRSISSPLPRTRAKPIPTSNQSPAQTADITSIARSARIMTGCRTFGGSLTGIRQNCVRHFALHCSAPNLNLCSTRNEIGWSA